RCGRKGFDDPRAVRRQNHQLAGLSGRISTQKPRRGGALRRLCFFRRLCSDFFAHKVSGGLFAPSSSQFPAPPSKFFFVRGKRKTENADKENRVPLLLPHLSPRILRHSFASRAVESNAIPPKHLQTMLGHSSIQVTMDIYAEISDEALQNSMSAFDGI
ncbi:MAG: tyrosine-type recombinase/integrase, partial [Oscillospiraceae bacterium]|nr:tyrosine-type recombinase/integrase [Oscillospiraceae bacterium]